jgi:hypothetical protein
VDFNLPAPLFLKLHVYILANKIVFDFKRQTRSTTTCATGGLDFTARGGKRQGHEVPQSLWVELSARHPVWKTQSPEGQLCAST